MGRSGLQFWKRHTLPSGHPACAGHKRQYGLALSSWTAVHRTSRRWRSWRCCKLPTATLGTTRSACLHSGTDNSATEASLNKMFTTSWPLQLFVQLTAFWAHARNVLLQPFREGAMIGQLARFESRTLQPCGVLHC